MKYLLLALAIIGMFYVSDRIDRRGCMLGCRDRLTLDGTEDDCERIC